MDHDGKALEGRRERRTRSSGREELERGRSGDGRTRTKGGMERRTKKIEGRSTRRREKHAENGKGGEGGKDGRE